MSGTREPRGYYFCTVAGQTPGRLQATVPEAGLATSGADPRSPFLTFWGLDAFP